MTFFLEEDSSDAISKGSQIQMDYSSDEFEFSDDEYSVAAASVSKSVATTTSKSSTCSRGLPQNIEKQLLIDIESNGGLRNLADKSQGLSDLLDRLDRKIYGNRGEPIRRQIGQKIQRLRKGSQATYNRRLSKLGITPATIPVIPETKKVVKNRVAGGIQKKKTRLSSPPREIQTTNPTPTVSPLPSFKSPPPKSQQPKNHPLKRQPAATKNPICLSAMAPTKYGTLFCSASIAWCQHLFLEHSLVSD